MGETNTMKNVALVVLIATGAFTLGVLVGYAGGARRGPQPVVSVTGSTPAPAAEVVNIFRRAAGTGEQKRQDCIRERLGAERYAALVLNPSAATAEDQFKTLPCQQL